MTSQQDIQQENEKTRQADLSSSRISYTFVSLITNIFLIAGSKASNELHLQTEVQVMGM